MTTGTVSWFHQHKGFGFIEPDDGTPDVFVTIRAIQRSGLGYVYVGQRVSYEIMPSISGGRSVFNLRAAPAPPPDGTPHVLAESKRAVLFVDQTHLQRLLGHELKRQGFDVILPVTLDEARRALQPSVRAPDLLVMNFRNAGGDSLELLDAIRNAAINLSVVLITEPTDATVHHPIAIDGVRVLLAELDSFSRSVRSLCRPKGRARTIAELD